MILQVHDTNQLMVNWWFGARWFGFPMGSPKLKGIGILWGFPIQIPNHRAPNHQLTIRWLERKFQQNILPNGGLIGFIKNPITGIPSLNSQDSMESKAVAQISWLPSPTVDGSEISFPTTVWMYKPL